MKVPIEVNDDQLDDVQAQVPETEAVEPEVVEAEVLDADDADAAAAVAADSGDAADDAADDAFELDEEAMVEAAKRAGEAAAEADFKGDADKLRSERDELQQQLDNMTAEVEAAKAQATEAVDRLARLQADWDNYRRRTATERLQEKERAAEKLVLSLLPVLDDMERASAHAMATAEGNEQLVQFVEGVDAVHDKMLGILAKEGVEVLDPAGEAFDPSVHQAFGRVEDTEAYDDSVAQVYQKGYKMGGKLIRTAMVTVTYGGPRRPAPEADAANADATNADAAPGNAGVDEKDAGNAAATDAE